MLQRNSILFNMISPRQFLTLCLLLGTTYSMKQASSNKEQQKASYKFARCDVAPNPSKLNKEIEKVYGTVHFRQREDGGSTYIFVQLRGFNSSDDITEHGFHIHSLGTIYSGCEGAKGHYNSYGSLHGSPLNDERHVGDLGNVLESSDGTVITRFAEKLVSLVGPYSVMGRGIVVHELPDDLGLVGDKGSLTTGNAGRRLACCIIAASDGEFWGIN